MTGRWLMPVRWIAFPDPVRILALLLLLLGFPFRAAAQRIEGSVVDREDGTPIQGALVLLVDSEGRDVAGGLTDEGGSFRLEVPAPGQHRLRVWRIGYEAYMSDPVEVPEGQTVTIVLEVAKEAIELIPNGAWIVRRWWIRMPTVERMDGVPLRKRDPDRDGVMRYGRSRSAPGRR